jgi:Tol biopolymer transport system component
MPILRTFASVALVLVVGWVMVSGAAMGIGKTMPLPPIAYVATIPYSEGMNLFTLPLRELCIKDINIYRQECFLTADTMGNFAFLPSEDRIGYSMHPDQTFFLLESDLRGGHSETLIGCDCTGSSPSWSPDGKYIAFSSPLGISLLNREGNSPAFLVRTDRPVASGPAWSPNRTRIAFISGDVDTMSIQFLDVDGNLTPAIIDNTSGELKGATFNDVIWSPDGNHLLVGTNIGVFSIGMNSNNVNRVLTNGDYRQLATDLSP